MGGINLPRTTEQARQAGLVYPTPSLTSEALPPAALAPVSLEAGRREAREYRASVFRPESPRLATVTGPARLSGRVYQSGLGISGQASRSPLHPSEREGEGEGSALPCLLGRTAA